MQKIFEIEGCIDVGNSDLSHDEFLDKFIEFVEANGWYFGGGTKEIIDDHYVMPDGSKGKSVFAEDDE